MSATIIDHAEQRATTTAEQVRATRQEVIRLMREEIGPQHYAAAKTELPKLEQFLATEIRPFLDRLTRLAARGTTSLPVYVMAWVREITTLSEIVPSTIRRGIDGWERLEPPIWTDGRSIDISARACMVFQIRTALMNWNGVQSRLETLRAQIEQYIHESGWPVVSS